MSRSATDEIYERLADLIASRHTDSPNEALEDQISQHFQRLRALQQQEADRITALIDAHRAGPIGKALDILDRFDEIRAKYGNTSAKDVPSQSSDATETCPRLPVC